MPKAADVMIKMVTEGIRSLGKIQGQRNELQAGMIANELEKRSNFMWKMREKMQSPSFNMQRDLQKIFQDQFEGDQRPGPGPAQGRGVMGTAQPGAGIMQPGREGLPTKGGLMQQFARTGGIAPGFPGALPAGAPQDLQQAQPQPDIFSQQVKPTVRLTGTGYTPHYASRKDFIYDQIQKKKRRGTQLTPKETKFMDDYLGLKDQPLSGDEYDVDKQKALAGEMEWSDLRTKYAYDSTKATEIGKIQTQDVINQIAGDPRGWKAGYREFLKREREATMAGIDAAAVYRAFGYSK